MLKKILKMIEVFRNIKTENTSMGEAAPNRTKWWQENMLPL